MGRLRRLKPLLTGLLVMFLSVTAASAFSDTQGHPSEAAINKWSTEYGLLSGYGDGTFRPNDSITKGAFAGILDRMMHFPQKSPASAFRDTAGTYWEDALLKAHAYAIMLGSNGYAEPSATITRQQAVTMISRAFDFAADSIFPHYLDDASIDGYARSAISEMAELGYLEGVADDYFRPQDPITRADVVRIFDNIMTVMILTETPLEQNVTGNVLVSCQTGATLRNMYITGDLYIAPGVKGTVTLENVTIGGETRNFSFAAGVVKTASSAAPTIPPDAPKQPNTQPVVTPTTPDSGATSDSGKTAIDPGETTAPVTKPGGADSGKTAIDPGETTHDPRRPADSGTTPDSGQTPIDPGETTSNPNPPAQTPDSGQTPVDNGETTAPVVRPDSGNTRDSGVTGDPGETTHDPGRTKDSGKTSDSGQTPADNGETTTNDPGQTPADNGETTTPVVRPDSGNTRDSGVTGDPGETTHDPGRTKDSGKTSDSGKTAIDPGETTATSPTVPENPENMLPVNSPTTPAKPENPENQLPTNTPATPATPANPSYGTLPNKSPYQMTVRDVYTPGRTTGQYFTFEGSRIPIYAGAKTRNVYSGEFVWRDKSARRLGYNGTRYTAQFGVDVSAYQNRDRANGTINWAAAKADGVQFAMIRVGLRGTSTGALREDAYYARNIDGAMAQGIQTGAYIFSQATTIAEAIEEADFVIARLRNHRINGPVSIDWEMKDSSYRVYGTSKEMATACAVAFCKRVAAAGYTPMVYNSRYVAYIKYDQGALAPYMMWYPQYTTTDYPYPNLYYQMDYWQYTDSATVDGIGKKIDANIWFKPKG